MLDISYFSDINGDKPSFIIKYSELKLFSDAFSELKSKTGVYIDPYGRCRIYPSHQKMLSLLLSTSKDKRVVEFLVFLEKALQSEEVLLADGE